MTTLAVLQKNGLSVNEYFSKRLLEMIKLERSNFVFTNLGVEMNVPKNEGTKNFTVRRYNHLPLNTTSEFLLYNGNDVLDIINSVVKNHYNVKNSIILQMNCYHHLIHLIIHCNK